jgi:magnesium chelatase subunit ChlI-like protein
MLLSDNCHVDLSDVVLLLASPLSGLVPEHYPPLRLSPWRQKQKAPEAVLLVLLALAAQEPVLCIMVSLAHHGLPLLDALPERKRHVLEVLRQPLEKHITRLPSPTCH